jgi:hypothetical protein
MRSDARHVDEYMDSLGPKWKPMMERIRSLILENIPEGFEEKMNYGMIGYVVPLSIFPEGYHVKPGEPLPFINLAAQKNNISLYHMGIYGMPGMEDWFKERYQEAVGRRPDMGRACIRFRKEEDIPYQLLEELLNKITVDEYVENYKERMSSIKKK